jgi:hypothetical protein
MRQNQSNNPAENGSFIAGVWAAPTSWEQCQSGPALKAKPAGVNPTPSPLIVQYWAELGHPLIPNRPP